MEAAQQLCFPPYAAMIAEFISFCPETALFRNHCVNLRLVRRTMYASAQCLDFLDLAKNCSFPNQKRASV